MKSLLFKFSISLLLVSVASFSFSQRSEEITFLNRVQKFPKTNEGSILRFNYIFNYTGNISLSILPPEVDCSCTTVLLPKNNIQLNSIDTIKVSFDTNHKIGYQERNIIIKFITEKSGPPVIEKEIIFKGVVKASQATKKAYKLSKKK